MLQVKLGVKRSTQEDWLHTKKIASRSDSTEMGALENPDSPYNQ